MKMIKKIIQKRGRGIDEEGEEEREYLISEKYSNERGKLK